MSEWSQPQSPSAPQLPGKKQPVPFGKCATSHHPPPHHQRFSQSWPQHNEISGTTTTWSHRLVCQPLWHSKLGSSGFSRRCCSRLPAPDGMWSLKISNTGGLRPLKGLLKQNPPRPPLLYPYPCLPTMAHASMNHRYPPVPAHVPQNQRVVKKRNKTHPLL